MGCIICKLISEEIEVTKVYEDDVVVAVMDIQPINPGHLFIAPKRHIESISELDEEVGSHVFKTATRMTNALRRSGLKCDGVNLLLADGGSAGQEIPHIHLHVIPRIRMDGSGFKFRKGSIRPPDRKELERIAGLLRRAFG
ncbi:MAG: HIT family protein [Candidatus Bathyarchaeota archaeon]|nr:MAG: HIT family protein [Candidatus Bathyarchaeota archaeon]